MRAASRTAPRSAPDDTLADFVSVVLADTEDTWNAVFAREGQHYREPVFVLFRDRVRSACGLGSAPMGPFYCPGDSTPRCHPGARYHNLTMLSLPSLSPEANSAP